ncbi:CD226 antigen-like [Maylandia zebra]|uniref:CD226 antigen-like n=1 Tax=Maylandia zebra TaxID=106582 RepID=UPI00403C0B43
MNHKLQGKSELLKVRSVLQSRLSALLQTKSRISTNTDTEMAAGTALLCCTLLFVLVFVSAEQKTITAESGQDVTLTCRAPNNNIRVIKWERFDLGDDYVLLYQDGLPDSTHQHPSFKNRVDLQDRQMKDGDVSLILKDVTVHDAGAYECRFFMEETRSWKSISSLNLIVTDQKTITAESGQDVTLTCRAPNNNIFALEWERADLKSGNVLFRVGCDIILDDQHPSFKNRVDLQDKEMKDGDVSLILKDVTINDAGTYECRFLMVEARSFKHSFIKLVVDPPGQPGGDRDEL